MPTALSSITQEQIDASVGARRDKNAEDRESILARVMGPMAPMGTPSQRDMEEAVDLAWTLDGVPFNFPGARSARARMEEILTRMLNAVINIPRLDQNGISIKNVEAYITTSITDSNRRFIEIHEFEPDLTSRSYTFLTNPGPLKLSPSTIGLYLARLASYYRQYRAVLDIQQIFLKDDHGDLIRHNAGQEYPVANHIETLLDTRDYGDIPTETDPKAFTPRHPAAILTDHQIVGMDFIDASDANIHEGVAIHDWSVRLNPEPHHPARYPSKLNVALHIPLIMAQGLAGQRLADIIEIDSAKLATLPPHAQKAWAEVEIESVAEATGNMPMSINVDGSDNRSNAIWLSLTLKPARQILWLSGALPHDHVAADPIEQAIINLAKSGETV